MKSLRENRMKELNFTTYRQTYKSFITINTVTEKENQSFFNLFPKIMVEDGISLYCLLLQ